MTTPTVSSRGAQINNSCMIGLAGLATDVQTMQQKLTFRTNMYKLREEREMKPSTFSNVVSSVLYERRFVPHTTPHPCPLPCFAQPHRRHSAELCSDLGRILWSLWLRGSRMVNLSCVLWCVLQAALG